MTDTTNALRALAELLTHAQPWPDHFRGAGERITLHLTTDFRDLILEALATAQPEAKGEGVDGRRRLRIACGCVMEGAARVIACRGHATRQAQGGGEES